ncbi:hypothetical protein KAFR_0H03580 [Kazachstania africana CBS 2517]|uniref:Uncharacterized protein n=1 Tax=Kazachstania africana (strain ATCC 22294 / BCRC 22015 / CBS 2517 / CECT 1963 / NBRC 1671 / NRRL Y-8276) TaxID=1071382 RepID=H2AYJ1_KAZAF|nr:hypothetical protein KAFR_0H03580 [Kazachstania africana CBS 2517]CCF59768.1 hypothetical protein KAFR_0H03580 [Kazachstania africana CBS 2517]
MAQLTFLFSVIITLVNFCSALDWPFPTMTEVNGTYWQAFNYLSCLNASHFPGDTLVGYDDAGILVVALNSSLVNTTAADQIRTTCYIAFRSRFKNALEFYDTEAPELEDATTLSAVLAQPQYLSRTEPWPPARSRRNHSSISSNTTLTRRTEEYYEMFLSEYSGCASSDLILTYPLECMSYASSFTSLEFSNPSSKYILRGYAWPHHDCTKGNEKSYVVGPGSSSGCFKRTTYSYYGVFQDDDCYGVEEYNCQEATTNDISSIIMTGAVYLMMALLASS